MPEESRRLSTRESLALIFRSWRLAAVALQSFASGLPLGLVWIAIPTWMTEEGVDIKVVGLFTLAQAPWTFKFLWSPLMDRYPPPWLGRKRGWILLLQALLGVLGLWLAGVADRPDAVWVIGALTLATGLAAASQDIAIDAYAVEVLHREEHGAAVGARTALYRAAMFTSGGLAITLASSFDVPLFGGAVIHWQGSWRLVNALLALAYLPLMCVTWLSPEPEVQPPPPPSLREVVWGPFVGFLRQHRALEILAFVVLYKLSDNLTQALTRPFLVQVGFNPIDVGVATATVSLVATLVGTFVGGLLTNSLGLGRALWIFGFFQIFSNLGYAAVAQVGVNRPLMFAAVAFEMGSTGLGSGAFGVLLLRLTQKRFSATQYALFSSLFSVPRVLAGPPAGLLADAIGWRDFFVLTLLTGIPGLVMLRRFVPWSVREPEFGVLEPKRLAPLSPRTLALRSALAGLAAWLVGLLTVASLDLIRAYRAGRSLLPLDRLLAPLSPTTTAEWTTAVALIVMGAVTALGTAATLAARRGSTGPAG